MSEVPEDRRRARRPFGRRLLAITLSITSALTIVTALTGPTVAHADTAVPRADVFDVDFRNGSPADHVKNRSYRTFGAPVVSTNDTYSHVTATFDGVHDAYTYDMADAWASTSTPNLLSGATVECWFRYNGAAQPTGELEPCSGIQTGGYAVQVNKNVVRTSFYINGAYRTLSMPLTLGTWYHVVGTYDGAAMKMYLNGTLAQSVAVTGPVGPPSGRYFVLGADTAALNPEKFAPVTVATSRIWSTALSADQVSALYATDTAAPAAVPAADVLDVDLAGGSFTDKAQGATPDPYAAPVISTDVALGKKAANFDGQGQAVVYPEPNMWDATKPASVLNSFTLQCDFRYNGSIPTATEMDVCSGKNTGGLAIYATADKIGTMAYSATAAAYRSVVSAGLATGVWHTAVSTYDGALLKLYVDGSLVDSTVMTGTVGAPAGDAKYFVIGGDTKVGGYPEFLANATVANARIWSTALSADQVATLNYQASGARQVQVTLKSTTPASGAKLTEPVTFNAKVTNQGAATGWTYTLDGTPISIGQQIGAGLVQGSHTIAITATDNFGRPLSYTVPFTSGDIPVAGGTDTQQGKGRVTLSTIATAAGKGDITTTFKAADAHIADGGFAGSIAAVPSTLDFSYSEGSTFVGTQVEDGQTSSSPSSHGLLPFQRFDVKVGEADASRQVRWSGIVDPSRTATLLAWNAASSAWIRLASSSGVADADTALVGTIPADAVDGDTAHVMVIGEDPFLDNLSARDSSAATPAEKDHFEDGANYDFSFVHWTDPQFIAEGATGGSGKRPAAPTYTTSSGVQTLEEQAVWAKAYKDALKWTADNASSKKIAYTANTGDIINNDLYDPNTKNADGSLLYGPDASGNSMDAQTNMEFSFASDAFKQLHNTGIVNQTIAGNHDNQVGVETGADSRFSKAFSAASYYAQAQNWPAGASYHAWDETTNTDGSTAAPGSDNQNNYVLFSAGGLDFVAVGLSYGVTKAEADWANSVFSRYSDRNGILITHSYLAAATASQPDGRNVATTGDGSRLYQQVAAANPNVFLVLAGHIHGVGTNLKTYQTNTTQITHRTVEMLADYQNYTMAASKIFTAQTCPTCVLGADGSIDVNGDGVVDHQAGDMLYFGAAYQRLLQFNVKNSTMSVDTYSPFFDDFGNTENDPDKRYNGAEDNFTIPVDLTSRKTSFKTDSLAVFSPTDTVIGTATAKSGFPVSVEWSGLESGRTYAWTATSANADGTTAGTVNQFGGVFVATAKGTDVTAPVITLPSSNTLDYAAAFTPLDGVGATDNADGDLTGSLSVLGAVDTTTAGRYTLIYSVSDANGNTTQVLRTVTVKPQVIPPLARTTLKASDVTIISGTSPELTATVTPAEASGEVQFNAGEDELCKGTIANGSVSCTVTTAPPVGTYAVTVDYTGDDTHAAAHSAIALTVKEVASHPAATTTTATPLTITTGSPATLKLAVAGGTATPTGTVDVSEGTTLLGRPGLVDGTAELTFSGTGLAEGTHTLTLAYGGDALHSASTGTVTVTVNPVPVVQRSATTVTAAPITVTSVKPASLMIKVSGGAAGATGTVDLKEGGRVIYRPGLVDGSAQLVLTTSVLPEGVHTLTLAYSGDATHAASTGTVKVKVVKVVKTSTKVSTRKIGKKLAVTVTVAPSTAAGKASIKIGSKSYTVTVARGKATLTVAKPKGRSVKVSAGFKPSDAVKYVASSASITVKL